MERLKHKIVSIEQLSDVIKEILNQYDEIMLCYFYGSYFIGLQNQFSDIDIGIVLKNEFKAPPLYFANTCSIIEEKFNYSIEIDLRILNDCTPRFLFNVIKNGLVIYSKDDNFRDEFTLRVIREYLEIKPMLDMFDRISIKEGLEYESKS